MTHSLDESSLAELLATLPDCPDPTAGLSDLTLIEGFIEDGISANIRKHIEEIL